MDDVLVTIRPPTNEDSYMKNEINIPPSGALDFLSLGALVHRLDPGIIPFRKASHCDIHVSGGEFNVSANLSDCFRLNTGVASAMVDYPIGDLIAERVRAMGVKPFYKRFKHDGVRGPNMATVYSDRGQGVRAPVVFYNRSNEAAGQIKPGDFNWKEIFGGGGDGYAAGFFYGLLSGASEQEAVNPRLGTRCVAHHVPRRHINGNGGAGEGVRQGRLGAHPAVIDEGEKMNMFDLTGEVAVVIGATGVLGGALADGLAGRRRLK